MFIKFNYSPRKSLDKKQNNLINFIFGRKSVKRPLVYFKLFKPGNKVRFIFSIGSWSFYVGKTFQKSKYFITDSRINNSVGRSISQVQWVKN